MVDNSFPPPAGMDMHVPGGQYGTLLDNRGHPPVFDSSVSDCFSAPVWDFGKLVFEKIQTEVDFLKRIALQNFYIF